MGSSEYGIRTLDNKSAFIRIMPPIKADIGSSILWFGPKISRHICGVIKPKNPIIPHKDTDNPTIPEVSMIRFLQET